MANDRATAAPAAIRKNPSGNGRSYRWASAWADASSASAAHANKAAARRAAHLIRLLRMHFKINQHRVAPSLAMGLNRKATGRVRTKGHSLRRVGVDRGLEVIAVQMKKSAAVYGPVDFNCVTPSHPNNFEIVYEPLVFDPQIEATGLFASGLATRGYNIRKKGDHCTRKNRQSQRVFAGPAAVTNHGTCSDLLDTTSSVYFDARTIPGRLQ